MIKKTILLLNIVKSKICIPVYYFFYIYLTLCIHLKSLFIGYTLQWEQKNKTPTKQEVNLNNGATSYTIRNLMPTTNYTIYLFAKTAKGPGAVSSADIESGVPPGVSQGLTDFCH